MPRALMEKVDRIWKQMSNVSRVMETLRETQEEMLEIKNIVTEMQNAFGGLISRLNMAKKNREFKDRSRKIPQTNKKVKRQCR